jgi:hypothetical protein
MNLNTRDLHVAICRLLTCAPPTPCPREEDYAPDWSGA